MKLNKTHQRETNYAAKISRNVLLNFCAIYQMQTADSNNVQNMVWRRNPTRLCNKRLHQCIKIFRVSAAPLNLQYGLWECPYSVTSDANISLICNMTAVRDLGIYVDSHASMKTHMTHIMRHIYVQNRVQLLRRTASDQLHSSISLTADSAIAGGVLGTDTPRLRQCDVGRRGKQSTRKTAVCDECCCTARLFSTEVRPHHTAAPGPSFFTRATADWVQARCACLPLLAWYGSVSVSLTNT